MAEGYEPMPIAITQESVSVLWGIASTSFIIRYGKLRILVLNFNTNNANPVNGNSKTIANLSASDYPSASIGARFTSSHSTNCAINTSGVVAVTEYASSAYAEQIYVVMVYVVA